MTRGLQVLAMLVLLTPPLAAQTPTGSGPVVVRQVVVGRQAPITALERALFLAVNDGAQRVVQQVRQVAPQPGYMLSGAPDVTGVRLQGHGVIVMVRVPAIRPTFALALRLMNDGRAVPAVQGGPERAGLSQPPLPTPFIDPDLIRDPDAVYTREVKAHLIDAMLENSRALNLGDDEFLTVFARDNTPLDLLDPVDHEMQTLEFRIKGSDLAQYHKGAISLEEARTRVILNEN